MGESTMTQYESSTDGLDNDELIDLGEEDVSPVRCSLVTGAAGTGKTYMVRERIATDPREGVLCATTGIAAVNLGTITINSLLKYFDTESLTNAYISGRLTSRLAALAKRYRNIYIDEVSMMAAEQLDLLYQATQAANRQKGVQKVNPEGLGIVLTGDFAQLPPIKARWAFEAECWPEFESGVERLTKNWRQGEGDFLAAINALRCGDGATGADGLAATAAEFAPAPNLDFNGTTIMSRNDEVDRFNWVALRRLKKPIFKVRSRRWYRPSNGESLFPPSEWKNIPDELELCDGAYVMILANDTTSGEFAFANGDCGWVVGKSANSISVQLVRNDEVVEVGMIDRHALIDECEGVDAETTGARWGEPWWHETAEKFVVGTVRYLPLRVAYASTCHKSQGLTLDRVQLDIRNAFFGHPAMTYVAVSRCRTAEGLRVVGSPRLLAERCRIDSKIQRWI